MKLIIDIPEDVYNGITERYNSCEELHTRENIYQTIANGKPYEEPMKILYLCDDHGCPGCEAGTNPDHKCKHTTDIAHAKNFEAICDEETGEVMCYAEKNIDHVVAQINFDEDKQKEFADEAARRIREEIENGELVVKESCQPVIIHHNGRDFNGYFDSSRRLLFGSYLAAEVANDFGFTWEEVEEIKTNDENLE